MTDQPEKRSIAGLVERELQQLDGILVDADSVLHSSLDQLAASVTAHGQHLEQVGDTRREAVQLAMGIEHRWQECADRIHAIVKRLPRLTARAQSVSATVAAMTNIVDTVEKLAYTTHLCALNASIAAERAGTDGAGFAVVAEEVAALPAKTTSTSASIRSGVDVICGDLRDTVDLLEQTTETAISTYTSAASAVGIGNEVKEHGHRALAAFGNSSKLRIQTEHAARTAKHELAQVDASRAMLEQSNVDDVMTVLAKFECG